MTDFLDDRLREVLDLRLARHVPDEVPPLAELRRRRLSRDRRPIAATAAGLAVVALVAGLTVPRWLDRPDRLPDGSTRGGLAGVPDEVAEATGLRYVFPEVAPIGYRYFDADWGQSHGRIDSRRVRLRPARLEHQPTVTLCVDGSAERDRCGPGDTNGVVVRRELNGLPMIILLFGENAEASVPLWETMPLTTDPARSTVFSGVEYDEACIGVAAELDLLLDRVQDWPPLDESLAGRAQRVERAVAEQRDMMRRQARRVADEIPPLLNSLIIGDTTPQAWPLLRREAERLRDSCVLDD
jgi:hypothetical protein